MKENYDCRTMEAPILLCGLIYMEHGNQGEVSNQERSIYIEHSEL